MAAAVSSQIYTITLPDQRTLQLDDREKCPLIKTVSFRDLIANYLDYTQRPYTLLVLETKKDKKLQAIDAFEYIEKYGLGKEGGKTNLIDLSGRVAARVYYFFLRSRNVGFELYAEASPEIGMCSSMRATLLAFMPFPFMKLSGSLLTTRELFTARKVTVNNLCEVAKTDDIDRLYEQLCDLDISASQQQQTKELIALRMAHVKHALKDAWLIANVQIKEYPKSVLGYALFNIVLKTLVIGNMNLGQVFFFQRDLKMAYESAQENIPELPKNIIDNLRYFLNRFESQIVYLSQQIVEVGEATNAQQEQKE